MEDIFDLAIGKSRTMVMLRKRLPYHKDETNFPTMSFYLWWAAYDGFENVRTLLEDRIKTFQNGR